MNIPIRVKYYVCLLKAEIIRLPFFMLLIDLVSFKRIVVLKYFPDVILIIFCRIVFAGTAAVGLGDGLTLTWCYWFLLGVGYILVTDKNLLLDSERKTVL